jgi:predicted Zn-dependent peptidase
VTAAGPAWACLVCLFLAAGSAIAAPVDKAKLRKTTSSNLQIEFERFVLANGQTVLLSPDPSATSVIVDQSFFAGALFEPADKTGLAHLAEHMMFSGTSGDTDYKSMLQARGARDLNAFTGYDLMTFHTVVPPEELPFALWVAADRLGTLGPKLDQAEVDRSRRIVVEERAVMLDDVAYGAADIALYTTMFPAPHPLRGMIIGVPEELARVKIADIQQFIGRCLVPANGILTIAGNFDPAVAREWLEKTVGLLPGGSRVATPPGLGRNAQTYTITVSEPRSRRPRVTFAWRLGEVVTEVIDVLQFGALLVMVYTDGTLGIDVRAGLSEYLGGAEFRIDFTMDHDGTKRDTRDNAEALFRYLTRSTAEDEIFAATLLAWDRGTMQRLESLPERARLLTRFEYLVKDRAAIDRYNERHWALRTDQIADIARRTLDVGRMTVHARPTNPRPPREKRE